MQVVIALVVTPQGFPLAYEVLAGNTRDSTTLRPFLRKIEKQYGKAERIWVMDRGIPTEEVLAEMRQADPPIYYLVGTPKGRLTKLEKALLKLPWQSVREGVNVKLLPKDAELYVLAQSDARILKERGIRPISPSSSPGSKSPATRPIAATGSTSIRSAARARRCSKRSTSSSSSISRR